MIVYDCEIIKAIPPKDKTDRVPGIHYCRGWSDFTGMGISVICACHYETNTYRIFLEDNFDEFQCLVDETDLVVGFNSLNFDNKLCRANGINVPDEKSADLLREVRNATGQQIKYRKGYSLDNLAKVNLGIGKSGDGALAAIWWQQQKFGRVIDYCQRDVAITTQLIAAIREQQFLLDPVIDGGRININPNIFGGPDIPY